MLKKVGKVIDYIINVWQRVRMSESVGFSIYSTHNNQFVEVQWAVNAELLTDLIRCFYIYFIWDCDYIKYATIALFKVGMSFNINNILVLILIIGYSEAQYFGNFPNKINRVLFSGWIWLIKCVFFVRNI